MCAMGINRPVNLPTELTISFINTFESPLIRAGRVVRGPANALIKRFDVAWPQTLTMRCDATHHRRRNRARRPVMHRGYARIPVVLPTSYTPPSPSPPSKLISSVVHSKPSDTDGTKFGHWKEALSLLKLDVAAFLLVDREYDFCD